MDAELLTPASSADRDSEATAPATAFDAQKGKDLLKGYKKARHCI